VLLLFIFFFFLFLLCFLFYFDDFSSLSFVFLDVFGRLFFLGDFDFLVKKFFFYPFLFLLLLLLALLRPVVFDPLALAV